jgi:hypothetical protein
MKLVIEPTTVTMARLDTSRPRCCANSATRFWRRLTR